MSETSHVLARKYRPQVFSDLIGQEALVQTITNAIEHNRLAHAYMLTGIRGVGKTSSARIIAKGLNCIGPDGNGNMTPNPCGKCKHCQDIAMSSHIDVVEIDAASNTGVDNIREIIEGAKYNPVSARFKIYIIDEVHMLSKQAFNALLKTLEEPPARIKFILATTEIRKVPITILSRCQRFDLKRLDETVLTQHLQHICAQEGVSADEEALRLIARAGDGSCRDSLSLLDQAMTQFNTCIRADDARQMLCLADKSSLFDLYEAVMKGQSAEALNLLDAQYNMGADPTVIAQDLLALTHWLTRIKIMPDLAKDITIAQTQRERGAQMAGALSMSVLTSAWQVLLKGLNELKTADNPLTALEMLLIRLSYMADLPTPAQIIEDIKKNGITPDKPAVNTPISSIKNTDQLSPVTPAPVVIPAQPVTQSTPVHPVAQPQQEQITQNLVPAKNFTSLQDIVNLAKEHKERLLAYNIETYIKPVQITTGLIHCSFMPETPKTFSAQLTRFLSDTTKINWEIRLEMTAPQGALTLKEEKEKATNNLLDSLKQIEPLKTLTDCYPKAKISRIKQAVAPSENTDTMDQESL